MLEKAFSLDTFVSPVWQFQAGHSYLLMQQYDEAVNRFLQTIEQFPGFMGTYSFLACAYVELDRLDDARDAITRFLGIVPQFTVNEAARRFPWRSDEVRERFLENLRKAGLPEG